MIRSLDIREPKGHDSMKSSPSQFPIIITSPICEAIHVHVSISPLLFLTSNSTNYLYLSLTHISSSWIVPCRVNVEALHVSFRPWRWKVEVSNIEWASKVGAVEKHSVEAIFSFCLTVTKTYGHVHYWAWVRLAHLPSPYQIFKPLIPSCN